MITRHHSNARRTGSPATLVALFFASLGMIACHDAAAPVHAGELVVAVGGTRTSIAGVDGIAGRVVARADGIPASKVAAALAPDSSMVYAVGVGRSGRELVALTAGTMRFAWHQPLYSPVALYELDGLWLGGTALAVSPDGSRLFVGGAYLDDPRNGLAADREAIAVLDAGSRHLIGTVGPLQVAEGDGLTTVPPCSAAPHGLIAAVGTRFRYESGQPSQSLLVTIDPATLAVIDTALVGPPGMPGGADTLRAVTAGPVGCVVYLLSWRGMLYEYDLVAHRVLAATPAAPGSIAVSSDGQTVYVTSYGYGLEAPGSGMVQVFGPNLEPGTPIDLRNRAELGGGTPVSSGASLSADGTRLYVATGTAEIGTLYPRQPLRIAVIDRATGELMRAIPLDDWGGARLFVAR